jgi:mono/diheme cytochrome c family protein
MTVEDGSPTRAVCAPANPVGLFMKHRGIRMHSHLRSSLLYAALLAASSIAWAGSAVADDAANDGWYTAAQADRGHQDFNNHCAQCHRPDLTGGPDVSPLIGGKFLSKWSSQKASDLIDFEHQKMPANNPGSVPVDQLYRITAYILQRNGFPAGSTPLSADSSDRPLKK